MNITLTLVTFLAFLLTGCGNFVGPMILSINPDIVHLDPGQSQIFNISGLNEKDFRIFTNFYNGESVCYSDCDPDAYGYVEKLGSGRFRYTLQKGKDSAKEKIIQLDIYPTNSNDYKVSALIYPN